MARKIDKRFRQYNTSNFFLLGLSLFEKIWLNRYSMISKKQESIYRISVKHANQLHLFQFIGAFGESQSRFSKWFFAKLKVHPKRVVGIGQRPDWWRRRCLFVGGWFSPKQTVFTSHWDGEAAIEWEWTRISQRHRVGQFGAYQREFRWFLSRKLSNLQSRFRRQNQERAFSRDVHSSDWETAANQGAKDCLWQLVCERWQLKNDTSKRLDILHKPEKQSQSKYH